VHVETPFDRNLGDLIHARTGPGRFSAVVDPMHVETSFDRNLGGLIHARTGPGRFMEV
jgi:hypothetical protein